MTPNNMAITGKHPDIITIDSPTHDHIFYDSFCAEKKCPYYHCNVKNYAGYGFVAHNCVLLAPSTINISEIPKGCLFLREIQIFRIIQLLQGKTDKK